jgi:hypothetical protein
MQIVLYSNLEQYLFLNISAIKITFVSSLYQRVETSSIEIFGVLSQPLPHLRFNLFVIRETFATKVVFTVPNKRKSPLQFLDFLLSWSGGMGSALP